MHTHTQRIMRKKEFLASVCCVVVQLDSEGLNQSIVRGPEELRTVVVSNLTAFTRYSVTVTAFTGRLENARRDGQATEPTVIRTMEEGEEPTHTVIQ